MSVTLSYATANPDVVWSSDDYLLFSDSLLDQTAVGANSQLSGFATVPVDLVDRYFSIVDLFSDPPLFEEPGIIFNLVHPAEFSTLGLTLDFCPKTQS